MVRAMLDGRKMMTRRILKPQLVCESHAAWPDNPEPVPSLDEDGVHCATCGAGIGPRKGGWKGIPVRFAVGDRIFVRENHRLTDCACTDACRGPGHVWYEADSSGYRNVAGNKLRPSIHMPRWASRLTLAVTGVKIERLQAITEADALAEGVRHLGGHFEGCYVIDGTPIMSGVSAAECFGNLWLDLHGEDAWAQNPFVVAITFRVVKANIDSDAARLAA